MKTALSRLRALFKKAPVTKIFTFVLITFFLANAAPAQIYGAGETTGTSGEPSSLSTYLNHGQSGFWQDSSTTLAQFITGSPLGQEFDAEDVEGSSGFITATTHKNGALQEVGRLSTFFYDNQPASFIVWAQDQYYRAQGAVSVSVSAAEINPNDTSSYAPGTGFEILQPVLGLWQLSANVVYGVLIIILIVIAFLILLRQPLGGKEVVTIANSLPSIVVTIVLVVFSYALCGLFIDAIYLGSNVAYNLLIGSENAPGAGLTEQVSKLDTYANPVGTTVPIKNVLQPDDPQMSIWSIFRISGAGVCNNSSFLGDLDVSGGGEVKCAFSYLVPATWQSNQLGVALEMLVDSLDSLGVTNGLIELILALAIFQTSFKLFMILLNSYLTLSFYPIIAPFVFLSGALPGGQMKALDDFFKTLGAASLNFIVIYAAFLLLVVFGHTAVDSTNEIGSAFDRAGQVQWVPPLLGYSQKQIFDATSLNNNGANIITSLLIFGLYMAIPNITELIKKFLEVSSPFAQLAQTGKDITKVGKDAMGIVGAGVSKVMGGNFFGG